MSDTTVGTVFEQGLNVIRSLKASQVKNSPMYWVVEIVEHESKKVLDLWKKRIIEQSQQVIKTDQPLVQQVVKDPLIEEMSQMMQKQVTQLAEEKASSLSESMPMTAADFMANEPKPEISQQ